MSKLSRLEINTERKRKIILSRYLAGLVVTSVAVVASLNLFFPIKAKITQIDAISNTLMIETDVELNDSLVYGSLIVVLESATTYYEKAISPGVMTTIFEDLVFDRTYRVKIKADVGLGLQTLDAKTYQLKKDIYAYIHLEQYQDTIYYNLTGIDEHNFIKDDFLYLDIYENQTFIRRDEISINSDRSFSTYNSLIDINHHNITYTFILRYKEREGEIIIRQASLKTTNTPYISGSAYLEDNQLYYYFYIEDFNHKMTSQTVNVQIISSQLKTVRSYTLDEEPYVNDLIEDFIEGYFIIEIYIELDNKYILAHRIYPEQTGEESWTN